ncbi:hypothetical protein KSP40_PGU018767 [Platanthera guangdongensis]|uniref:GTD-binding domain-containing protein n=1 Tax=Platanthera guangdongensis TaxID=2320717 RepID=A0ABR2LJM4_9ASPA
MAASKFASKLRRNTDRMTFLLIYTALEWILIIFLFLNAILSYAIEKFASFFGLKPPCIFCSRIDHLFDPGKGRIPFRDFLCESHAGEVSRLGFCSNHRRLAEAGDMCEDCAASKPGETDRTFSLLSWMKRSEQGEKDLRCSCCGVALESGFYSPYILLKTKSWDVLECIQKEKSEVDAGFELEEAGTATQNKEEEEEARLVVEDASMDVFALRAEKTADFVERILPIELIDSSTMAKSLHLDLSTISKQETMAIPSTEIDRSEIITSLENHSCVLLPAQDPCDDFSTDLKNIEAMKPPLEDFEEHQASEEDGKGNDEANCEISIGSEICDQEQIEETQFHEVVSQPDPASHHQHLNGVTETLTKDSVAEIEPSEQHSRQGKNLKICPILNEIEEERMMPETPTTPSYIDSYPVQHKRFLLERRESGTESLDGSIAGDVDYPEPPTIDRLKAALKSERKALIALYTELEEERSASAIAANQTMAMITRLQQEKAAMQMEALQYQRMMEEQSEYDQEAVQLLNELMMKREKEKQELEKKVEVYRHKVHGYEAMERRRKSKGSGSGTSWSAEESDELSVESQVGTNEFIGSMEEEEEGDDDVAAKHLMQFEEERLSILGQLKTLEEKLLNHLPDENGHGINGDCELSRKDDNGGSVNEKISTKSTERSGKKLLPLFDAINLENEEDDSYKKLEIAEQVDHVYERLQALEADREFLKHCLSSLKKGDRGLNLLQEILQHLRDLRIMELHSRNVDV